MSELVALEAVQEASALLYLWENDHASNPIEHTIKMSHPEEIFDRFIFLSLLQRQVAVLRDRCRKDRA
jgi:hypothetical protein